MYEEITRNIRVAVEPSFLDEQSEPEQGRYIWAYRVTIENRGAEPVQLISRYWRITDSRGRTQEVHGDGVVGEQPVLHPGESFEYTSGTPLTTPSGIMVGSYYMETEAGDEMKIAIPAFSLDSPHQSSRVN